MYYDRKLGDFKGNDIRGGYTTLPKAQAGCTFHNSN